MSMFDIAFFFFFFLLESLDDGRGAKKAELLHLDIGFSTVGTQNVIAVSQETLSDERNGAFLAIEMFVVPMTIFERNILGTSESL